MTVVSAIVVDFRGGALLERCLAALHPALARLAEPSELIIVDNSGGLGEIRDARLVSMRSNAGFAGGVVAGLTQASGEWIALVNNDAFLAPDCLARLLATGRRRRAGSCPPQIRFDARPTSSTRPGSRSRCWGSGTDRLGAALGRPRGHEGRAVLRCLGRLALYHRAMLDAVGDFDSTFFAYLGSTRIWHGARA